MHRALTVALGLALAACGTPQENCIRRETRDLRVVDRLIAETATNLDRGYALEEYTRTRVEWQRCYRKTPSATPGGKPTLTPDLCLEREEYTETRPVAIDLNAEARKLESLKTKRAQLARQAQAPIAQCQADHPE